MLNSTLNNGIMEEYEITMDVILSVFNNTRDEKRLKDIKDAVVSIVVPDLLPSPEVVDYIHKKVESLIKEELKKERESRIAKKTNGKYKKRSVVPPPPPLEGRTDKLYEGAAGEMAVISELLFRGYNANRMIVDKGIDIVAVKDNVYRYIQVKTSYIKSEGRINWQIDKERFDVHVTNQLKYILIARYNDEKLKMERNMFFVLNSDDINRGIKEGWIKEGEEKIIVKVKFHPQSGLPFFYDDNKEQSAGYFLNKFDI